ncbi:MAG: hypothetical protein HYY06_13195 [Deltaproteobacteria bacterium]|nr:hypothetical protein [Deltaproteobacteria bacterium]
MTPKTLLAVLVAHALAACIVAPQTPPTLRFSQTYAGQTPIRVLNASARPICFVHVAPAGQVQWGDDWLGANETIPSGTMRQIGVAPGMYNVRLDDCSHSPLQLLMAVDLTGPREIVIHEGAPPAIPPTAGFMRIELVAMAPAPQPTVVAESGSGWGGSEGSAVPESEPAFGGGSNPSARSDPEPASSGPQTYSLTLHNSCDRTVGIFHGSGRPPFGSGTYGSIGSNTTQSYSGFAPETFWIIDDSRNPVSTFTTSGGSQRVEVLESCTGFAPN